MQGRNGGSVNGAPLVTATDLLKQAGDAARNDDYATARRLRSAATVLDADFVAAKPTPRWDSGLAHFVPGPVITPRSGRARSSADRQRPIQLLCLRHQLGPVERRGHLGGC